MIIPFGTLAPVPNQNGDAGPASHTMSTLPCADAMLCARYVPHVHGYCPASRTAVTYIVAGAGTLAFEQSAGAIASAESTRYVPAFASGGRDGGGKGGGRGGGDCFMHTQKKDTTYCWFAVQLRPSPSASQHPHGAPHGPAVVDT